VPFADVLVVGQWVASSDASGPEGTASLAPRPSQARGMPPAVGALIRRSAAGRHVSRLHVSLEDAGPASYADAKGEPFGAVLRNQSPCSR
jgi:hypothetical protein